MLNRRRHPRLPVIKDIAKEVFISTDKGFFPGIIMNLSSGGMLLMAYSNIPVKTEMCLIFDFPSLETGQIFGKIIRSIKKSVMWQLAVQFTQINTLDSKAINRLAIDFTDCENKIILGAVDVCRKECSYYGLCEKKQKIK